MSIYGVSRNRSGRGANDPFLLQVVKYGRHRARRAHAVPYKQQSASVDLTVAYPKIAGGRRLDEAGRERCLSRISVGRRCGGGHRSGRRSAKRDRRHISERVDGSGSARHAGILACQNRPPIFPLDATITHLDDEHSVDLPLRE